MLKAIVTAALVMVAGTAIAQIAAPDVYVEHSVEFTAVDTGPVITYTNGAGEVSKWQLVIQEPVTTNTVADCFVVRIQESPRLTPAQIKALIAAQRTRKKGLRLAAAQAKQDYLDASTDAQRIVALKDGLVALMRFAMTQN